MFRHYAIISTIILAFFTWSPAAFAAAYMKIDGIDGESSSASGVHKGWIAIDSFSLGISQNSPSGSGNARRRASLSPDDLTVIKPVDLASPEILEAATRGKVFPEITVKYEQNSKTYISTMFNVQISSVEQKGEGEHWPKEHISFTYQKITWDYGNGTDTSKTSWDVRGGR